MNFAINGLVERPSIVVQGDKTIGIEGISEVSPEKKDEIKLFVIVFFLAVHLLIPTLYFTTKLFRRLKGYDKNLNNIAFLFLHNNQFQIAKELLEKQIKSSGGSSHELSNLALTKYLMNENKQEYDALFRMAEFISESKYGDFVILFNKFIVSSKIKDYVAVKDLFIRCIKLSKKEFKKYLNHSMKVSDLRTGDIRLDDIIKPLEQQYYV